ncbi:DUF3108 domain-containing protein [Agrobacterium sp. a22-2]|uniref:DUF3108 domain-containing protein n=1 Tax=Agrobacterium sp. a22-2 TaxID=2283840 RepID=UPI0014453119|nr:DUF3108 domain-containing protein [Agrobacterium sp. a22-2]NKN37045.1 DUF3108 domain-containing protein [Agrobacterium sp. a22-2]
MLLGTQWFSRRRLAQFAIAATAILGSVSSSAAADQRYKTEYRITLAGLPIANASFVTQLDSRTYSISGSVRSSGIVDLITKITAQTTVSGTVQGSNKLQAKRYSLVYKSDERTRTYEVRFANGDVTSTTMKPSRRSRAKNWVPVAAHDLKSVLDPISGLIFAEGDRICPKTLPIYDGESRMDLVLSPKGTRTFTAGDFTGEAIVCGIRYVPKSGFAKGRSDIEYLRKASDMEIWFAKTEVMKVYAPVYARVPTRMGPLYITAVNFGG